MKAITCVFLLAATQPTTTFAQSSSTVDDNPKIAVTGEAVVNVKPDKILVNFGIETSDADIIAAKKKNSEVLQKAIAVIRAYGVPEKEIQTDYLSIEPRWKNEYKRGDFIGYFVRNTFSVTPTEPEKVEELVTKVLQSGVNNLHGVDFQTTEFKKCRDQARELALSAAKEKAEKMASVLGQSLGAAILITENPVVSPWWYFSSWAGWRYGRTQGMAQNVSNVSQDIPGGGSGDIPGTVVLGKISIRASVGVTFELKK